VVKKTDKILAKNIRMKRKQAGLSQKKLAELAGVAETTIVRMEKLQQVPRASTLEVIANVLEVELDELYSSQPAISHKVFVNAINENQRLRAELDALGSLPRAWNNASQIRQAVALTVLTGDKSHVAHLDPELLSKLAALVAQHGGG